MKSLSGMMRRSWREGQGEIRRGFRVGDREKEGGILEGREVLL